MLNRMHCIVQSGAQWRELSEAYGFNRCMNKGDASYEKKKNIYGTPSHIINLLN